MHMYSNSFGFANDTPYVAYFVYVHCVVWSIYTHVATYVRNYLLAILHAYTTDRICTQLKKFLNW